jgi:transposase InsO family protein
VEGKLYLCSLLDGRPARIVGYSIADRMTQQLAVSALRNTIALSQPVGTVVHSDRGSQTGLNWTPRSLSWYVDGKLRARYNISISVY